MKLTQDEAEAAERMRAFLASGAKEVRDSTYPGGYGQFTQDEQAIIAAFLREWCKTRWSPLFDEAGPERDPKSEG